MGDRNERCFCSHLVYLTSFMLNIWDIGGQTSLRSYWRNYFESTDGLVWVVDSIDRRRMDDCKKELNTLLKEEVDTQFVFLKFHLGRSSWFME